MTEAYFQTFMLGGLLLLVSAAMAIAWIMWRERDTRQDAARASIHGISHEYRLNVKRLMAELSSIANGNAIPPSALRPSSHPQLDAVNNAMLDTDRKALAVMNASYRELDGKATTLRAMIEARQDATGALKDAMQSVIDGIATLYLWDEHKGKGPEAARSTRSWDVRDWMKDNNFDANIFPGMHLRDVTVERLRTYGMTLTPKPLVYTANEYYEMKYDRHADPRGIFGKRKYNEDGSEVKFRDRLPGRRKKEGDDSHAEAEPIAAGATEGEPKKRFSLNRFRKRGEGDSPSATDAPAASPSQTSSDYTYPPQGE